MARKRIFIVEDHEAMRTAMVGLISREQDLEVCGTAATPHEALATVATLQPDLVLVDISLPQMSGIDLMQRLHATEPALYMLVVSGHSEALYAERAMAAGARGYLVKHRAASYLIDAIRQVLAGGIFVNSTS